MYFILILIGGVDFLFILSLLFLFKLVAVQRDSAHAVVNLWENLTPGTLEHLG